MKKKAVGLRYLKDEDSAPKLLVKGEGRVAEKIIEIAKEHNIYVKEDKDLVEILSTLDLYEEIPEELYSVIAEILLYIYSIERNE